MTRADQKTFINTVCKNLKKGLLEKIKDIPEEWDGHELRLWVKDYYETNFVVTSAMKGSRLKDYKNEIIVKNLT